jgi:hypothetical protein
MKTFFIFILLFIIAYYLIKAILRLFITFFPGSRNANNNNDGELKFDKTNEKKKRFNKNIVEYIDYEEIKK